MTASFVGRRGWREREKLKERKESSRVGGVGEMDIEITLEDGWGRQKGEEGEEIVEFIDKVSERSRGTVQYN